MRVLPTILLHLFFICSLFAQISPQEEYPKVFNDVQLSGIFSDSKTFADYAPIIAPDKIDSSYLAEKQMQSFLLEDFVKTYFISPENKGTDFNTDTNLSIEEHIVEMWDILSRKPQKTSGSFLALKYPYIVPGGRFQEIYYWDTYFSLLGLAKSDERDLLKNMVLNIADLINRYGYIPNGNRTYYLSRSQPPFFALMLQLLRKTYGDEFTIQFLPQLEKEYAFWMNGKEKLSNTNTAIKRVVLLPSGAILNRYWDNNPIPRAEAYKEDLEIAKNSKFPDSVIYRNIRATCESGWDFSSRWTSDNLDLSTLQTTNILPIDLNCLLYKMEETLAELYEIKADKKSAKYYSQLAKKRAKAISQYFWDKDNGFYTDFNFVSNVSNKPEYLSGVYPLFVNIASKKQAEDAAFYLEQNFLKDGGLVTSMHNTGQQWDSPNGWAPLQYISVSGLINYGYYALADTIIDRWLRLNRRVFMETGKLVEKYNVVNPSEKGGGGEYPNQDGFGWTNGVFIELSKMKESK